MVMPSVEPDNVSRVAPAATTASAWPTARSLASSSAIESCPDGGGGQRFRVPVLLLELKQFIMTAPGGGGRSLPTILPQLLLTGHQRRASNLPLGSRRFEVRTRGRRLASGGGERFRNGGARFPRRGQRGGRSLARGDGGLVPLFQILKPLQLRGGCLLLSLAGRKDLRGRPGNLQRADQILSGLDIGYRQRSHAG